MQTVSATYTQLMQNGGWQEVSLVVSNPSSSANKTTFDKDSIVKLRTSHRLYDKGVSVGNATAGTIEVELIANSNQIPSMAKLVPQVRLTDGTTNSEWLQRGVYFVDTREYDRETGILRLTGFDAMLRGEQDYMQSGNQGTWPQVDINVLCDIAKRLGLGDNTFTAVENPTGNPKNKGWYYKSGNLYYLATETSVKAGRTYYTKSNSGIDLRTLPLINKYYKVGYPGYGEGAYTVREVLGYIGSMYAGNWIINDIGQLRLIVVGDIPPETNYLVTENDDRLVLGSDRILLT